MFVGSEAQSSISCNPRDALLCLISFADLENQMEMEALFSRVLGSQSLPRFFQLGRCTTFSSSLICQVLTKNIQDLRVCLL